MISLSARRHSHGWQIPCWTLTLLFLIAEPAPVRGDPPSGGGLSLDAALDAALRAHPALLAQAEEIEARAALVAQAGRLPNPELETEIENLGGSGARRGFDGGEVTLLFSQLVELGDKRGGRERLADYERAQAVWRYDSLRRSVVAATTKAFFALLAAQARVALAAELKDLTDRSAAELSRQVEAGAVAPMDGARTRLAASEAESELLSAQRELQLRQRELARSWGSSRATFTRAVGDLEEIAPPPSVDELLTAIHMHPDLRRWEAEVGAREQELRLARAARVPDVTIGVGPRYFSDDDSAAAVVVASVPLPVFDRKDDALAAARSALERTRHERHAALLAAQGELIDVHHQLQRAYDRIVQLREHSLPAAREAHALAQQGYQRGAGRYFDLLDTRQTLFRLRAEHLTSSSDYHAARAELERLRVPSEEPHHD